MLPSQHNFSCLAWLMESRRKGVVFILLLLLILLAWLYLSFRVESIEPAEPAELFESVKPDIELPSSYHQSHSALPRCTQDCHTYTERLYRYCHTSLLDGTEHLSSHEGTLANNGDQYELVHLHIVARHGDRTPLAKLRMGSAVYYECGLNDGTFNWNGLDDFPLPLPLSSSLKFNRHIRMNPGTKEKECTDFKGAGVLTAIGYKQHAALGKLMQERYQTFVSKITNNVDSLRSEMFIQSTEVMRTTRSLSAFMLGFLPDSQHLRQATTIHISKGTFLESPPPGIETVFNHCHGYLQRVWPEDRRQTGFTAKENNRRYPITNLCRMFGLSNMCRTLTVSKVFEQVIIRGCHQPSNSLPCNGASCLNYSQALELFRLIDWAWNNGHPLKSSIIALAPFLRHSVLTPMERLISNYQLSSTDHTSPGSYPLMVSLTHDDTITKLLTSLGIPVSEWMPYASRLVFELWKNRGESSPEDFMVRMLFNGEPVTKQCGAWREGMSDELVPFPVFREFLTTGTYRDIESYNKICQIGP